MSMFTKSFYSLSAISFFLITISFNFLGMEHASASTSSTSSASAVSPNKRKREADTEQDHRPTKKQAYAVLAQLFLPDNRGFSGFDRAALELDQDLLPILVRYLARLLFQENSRKEIPFDYIFSSFVFNTAPDPDTMEFIKKLISTLTTENETLLHHAIRANNPHAVGRLIDFILDREQLHWLLEHRNNLSQTPFGLAQDMGTALDPAIIDRLETANTYLRGTQHTNQQDNNKESEEEEESVPPTPIVYNPRPARSTYTLLNPHQGRQYVRPVSYLSLYTNI